MLADKSLESLKSTLRLKLFRLKLIKLFRQLYPLFKKSNRKQIKKNVFSRLSSLVSSNTNLKRKKPRFLKYMKASGSRISSYITSRSVFTNSYQSHSLGRNLFLLLLWRLSKNKRFRILKFKKSNKQKYRSSSKTSIHKFYRKTKTKTKFFKNRLSRLLNEPFSKVLKNKSKLGLKKRLNKTVKKVPPIKASKLKPVLKTTNLKFEKKRGRKHFNKFTPKPPKTRAQKFLGRFFRKRRLRKRVRYIRWKSDLLSNFILSYYFTTFKSIAYLNVYSSPSNTIANLSDKFGNVLSRCSGGSVQNGAFKKAMRSKPYPARSVGEHLAEFAKDSKIKYVFVRYNGIGRKRKSVVKPFQVKRIRILGVVDLTKFPHNGCRKSHRPRK